MLVCVCIYKAGTFQLSLAGFHLAQTPQSADVGTVEFKAQTNH